MVAVLHSWDFSNLLLLWSLLYHSLEILWHIDSGDLGLGLLSQLVPHITSSLFFHQLPRSDILLKHRVLCICYIFQLPCYCLHLVYHESTLSFSLPFLLYFGYFHRQLNYSSSCSLYMHGLIYYHLHICIIIWLIGFSMMCLFALWYSCLALTALKAFKTF